MDNSVIIARAQAQYVRCIDDGQLEDWPDFFTEDCRYRVTTADNYRRDLPAGLIWADSRGMLKDRVSALREANIYEPHSYRHMLGQPAIIAESGDDVASETSFFVLRITGNGPTDIFASGRYVDRYRIDGDEALLRERIVVCDSSEIDTLLALPL
ncbi:aromatic-ring-hydroxylating dioxygenase subunit beta [Saccharopolyspora sp. K220]|uniref:aromatic-ring-hydroxylating dioxygenase subunit beta n=1 Tax=Saccharopolyspora soli TaxID=2926618 RepID=UPI001F599942|nr:aromatic-ring-hydroxylating dioxygenase subunit beta [Saccharopolyspora soli]MCI2416814.1 aromatic-ring-hydroxylating dioxygenase subunit beta [Saccharopolyspora soli]